MEIQKAETQKTQMQTAEMQKTQIQTVEIQKTQMQTAEMQKMEIQALSRTYQVKRIKAPDLPAVFALCSGNPRYYRHCPPFVSLESIQEDMDALPPGKEMIDKYYLGFWDADRLIAVMDLILAYPDKQTAFIGFFMTESAIQGKGIGSAIIEDACSYIKLHFSNIRLGYVKENMQSKNFWEKNGFLPTGAMSKTEAYEIVVMEKALS